MKYHWDESILLLLFVDTTFWKGIAHVYKCAHMNAWIDAVDMRERCEDIEWIRVYRTYTVLPFCCVSEYGDLRGCKEDYASEQWIRKKYF